MIEVPGYTIKSEICAGTNATILLALQTSLEREVAVKVVAAHLIDDKAYAERFLQVARALASFSHPNIVAVYDVGVTPERLPYFSMQYLPGGDFAARAQRGMPDAELLETIGGVARALGYVHQRGLIHRAITPRNVLYDAYAAPVLIDFGVAPTPAQDSHITSLGFPVEVSRFMSPEQARGGEQDPRSDIYCLGALCFYGLTGRAPYDGADGFAVAYAHVFEPIPRLPPQQTAWQPLIDKALAKDPKDRFASVEEFLVSLSDVGQQIENSADRAGRRTAATTLAAPLPDIAAPAVAPAAVPFAASAKPEPAAAGAKPPWLRALPIVAVLLGLGLIAFALIPRSPPQADQAPAPMPTPSAAPEAPAVKTEIAPSAPAAGDTSGAATTAAEANASAPAASATTSTAAPSTDAAHPLLDDAQKQLESEASDPAKAPTVVDPLVESLRMGRIDLAGQRLTSPAGSNALERFQYALKLDARNRYAKQGIVDIAKKYIDLADKGAPGKSSSQAELAIYSQNLDRAADVAKLLPEGADALKDIAARRRKAAEPYLAQARDAAEKWDKAAAKAGYEQALQLDPDNAAAREGIRYVATIGEPGFAFHDKFADGAQALPLVILPDARAAMARHPVTRAEFRRYWESAGRAEFGGREPGCRDRESIFRSSKKRSWENPDINQDDSHPVVCVGWREAAAYAQWLGKETGKRYRLPTIAEFDAIAAKAPPATCTSANLADAAYNKQFDSRDGSSCDDGFAATSPAERFPAVAGIYDIDGNVREWVGACGNGSAAPAGSNCRDFRVKGRGWLSVGAKEAATASDTYGADVSVNTIGFRVVRELSN